MNFLSLLSKFAITVAFLGTILAGPAPVWGIEHCPGDIQGESKDLVVEQGQCVEINGIRRKCGKSGAPNFARLVRSSRAISIRPKNGTLSDGGIGMRESRSCDGDVVDVRIIVYTPNPGFIGKDTVEFFSSETITITVKPSNPKGNP